jgi:UDP-glucose:(heptosyl)LPS alpha-1,3-glucosyltransferase
VAKDHLKIGFVRRGFSATGGAEAYLKRLARGVLDGGHEALLFTTEDWLTEHWPGREIVRMRGKSPLHFADELEALRPGAGCDVVMSLERVWSCDVYRAGDGVHRAWLDRRAKIGGWRRRVAHALNRKHLATLRLEQALFGRRSAERVIANSHLVQTEITQIYGYPLEHIDVVHNGVPVALFRADEAQRATTRASLGLADDHVAVLFVGSGWERKGLRFAIQAVDACRDGKLHLLVAGKGPEAQFQSAAVHFLGAISDLAPIYAAADIFLLPTIYDPFSNASLEALAAGLPVITTRGNGFAEIMRDGIDGSVIINPDDIGALCAAIRYWSDAARRDETRSMRVELASRYDMTANVTRTLAILLQAASAASTSGKMRNT